MKRIIITLLLLLATVGLFPKDDYKFVKNITVKKGENFKGNIVSVEGYIKIEGMVKESIIIIGGKIELNGHISGDVICMASSVIIGKENIIGGDLIILGDVPELNEGKVMGNYHFFELDLEKIKKTILPILTGSDNFFIINLIKTALWFILILIVFSIFSSKIYIAENIVRNNTQKIAFISLSGIFAFIVLLILFVFLSFLIIGIPFLFAIFIFYFVALTFGRTVILYIIGKLIAEYTKIKTLPPLVYLFIGFFVYAVLLFIPYIGKPILLILNIIEFGVGVAYFFRKRFKFK